MIEKSESIKELSAAMAKAQGAVKGALKDSKNPHFKNNYADLASVWEACRDALADNGLAVMQFPTDCEGGRINVVQLVTHASGEWIQSTVSIPLAKVDAQSYGSATTYARRYALAAAVGVAPEDDDGNAAVNGNGADNLARQKPEQPQAMPKAEFDRLMKLVDESGSDAKAMCEYYKVDSLRNLGQDAYTRAVNSLTKKIAANAKSLGDALGDSLPEFGGVA